MRRRKDKTPYGYNKIWPERVCPICGKRYLMMVRPEEWGYGSRDGKFQTVEANHLKLFCSRPCMDEYNRQCLQYRADTLRQTASFRVWWMYDQQFMEIPDIAAALGISESSVRNMKNDVEVKHWKELDYILTTA